jgi:hypothetical protein
MNVFDVSQLGLPPLLFWAEVSVNRVLSVVGLRRGFYSMIDENIFYYINSHCSGIFSRSASQEIPLLLWNSEVHFFVYKSRPLDPILNPYSYTIFYLDPF